MVSRLRVLAPSSPDLVSLAALKDELGITDPAQDAKLTAIIRRASIGLRDAIGYDLVRQRYREALPSFGRSALLVSRTPLAGVPSIFSISDPSADFDTATSGLTPVSEVFVADRSAGIMWLSTAFPSSATTSTPFIGSDRAGGSEAPAFLAEYWAGWQSPALLALVGIDVSFTAATSTITRAAGFPPSLQVDDIFSIAGSTSNNGLFTVKTITSSTAVTVWQSVTDQVAGASITIDLTAGPPTRLPGDLEAAALALARALWFARSRDPRITSHAVGDLRLTLGTTQGVPDEVSDIVSRYRRAA